MDKKTFNKTATHPLQTWEWGEFRKEWGNRVVRTKYGQIIFTKIPFTPFTVGTFIRGPKPTKTMMRDLKKIAQEQDAIFIKLEPNVKKNTKLFKLLRDSGAVPGRTLFTPTSFWIDLTKSEDGLIKGFKGKTRYNIRYAQKKGVKVVEDNSDKAFKKYLELMRETVARQGFHAHNEHYHRLMWKHLHKELIANGLSPIARLLVAKHKNEILTTWIIFHWKDFIYYPYGAWSGKWQNLQPNSLIMWEAIKLGKKLRAKTFDLWGREEGKGFTKFKEGFNPEVVEFLGSWDLIKKPLIYPIYQTIDPIRWGILKTKSKFTKPQF